MIETCIRAIRFASLLLAMLIAALNTCAAAAPADDPPASEAPASDGPETDDAAPPSTSDLDRALLESLDEAASDEADVAKAKKPGPAQKDTPADDNADESSDADAPTAQPTASDSLDDSLDDELLRDLGPADEATENDDDPLSRIGRKMQEAQRLIAQRQPGEPAQKLQQDIVAELDELLKQARQQKQQQQQSSSNKKPQQSRRDKPGQPQQQPAGGKPEEAGNEPARDSTEQQRPEAPAQPDIGQMQDMLRELWGHLPEHERQQVINSTIEKFVPKYESLIKEYFKRLSEATRSQP
jgi:hypothetical protein